MLSAPAETNPRGFRPIQRNCTSLTQTARDGETSESFGQELVNGCDELANQTSRAIGRERGFETCVVAGNRCDNWH